MKPSSISTLADYCMQQLGAPVIDIHVAEEQVTNRIEDALDFFQEFHVDATETFFLKHQVRANEIAVASATAFKPGETITGTVSGAKVAVIGLKTNGILNVATPVGAFVVGEDITGEQSGANGTITSYTTGDIDNGFVPVSDAVTAVSAVYPVNSISANNGNVFSDAYQMQIQSLYDLTNGSTIGVADFARTKQYMNTVDFTMSGTKSFRFNKRVGKLYIDMDWKTEVVPGDYIVAEAYRVLDPVEYKSQFNDRMLKKLATAYVKKQWGSNVKLHSGIVLPGGITVNGQAIFDEAVSEIADIETEIRDTYELPCMPMVG